MTLEELKTYLDEHFAGLVSDVAIHNEAVLAYVEPAKLHEAALKLRDDAGVLFNILSHMTALDLTPRTPRFELVYELYSIEHKHRLRLKVKLADTGDDKVLPEIDTLSDVWLTADWHERECYDLMGISFAGHPDPRRILLPDRWDGHPLRKEYPFDGKPAWELDKTVVDGSTMEGELGL